MFYIFVYMSAVCGISTLRVCAHCVYVHSVCMSTVCVCTHTNICVTEVGLPLLLRHRTSGALYLLYIYTLCVYCVYRVHIYRHKHLCVHACVHAYNVHPSLLEWHLASGTYEDTYKDALRQTGSGPSSPTYSC
jgi:hypothetical protein